MNPNYYNFANINDNEMIKSLIIQVFSQTLFSSKPRTVGGYNIIHIDLSERLFITLMTLLFYCQGTFFSFLPLCLFFVPLIHKKRRSLAGRCQTSKSGSSWQTCVKDLIT